MNLRAILSLLMLGVTMAYAEPPAEKPLDKAKQSNNDKEAKREEKPKDEAKEKPKQSETSHSLTLNGTKLEYAATAGTLPIKDAEGKTTADIFFIAYTRTKAGTTTPLAAETPAERPVTFSFNGGPGSSSVWMHM